jgi:hypothetical protein
MHEITRVEKNYFGFVCPKQPKMELLSADELKKCPVCSARNPFQLGKGKEFYGAFTG